MEECRKATSCSTDILTCAAPVTERTNTRKITLTDMATYYSTHAGIGTGIKITTQTNGSGYYLFPSIPAGLFSLTASNSGFKTNEIADIRIETGARRTANITLEVGAQATVVNVKAEVASVELSDAKVVGMIEIPRNRRPG